MDLDAKRFGRGPRELGGATDLINQYKLWPYHELFCKRALPLSETHYLNNVVGDTQIRKGEGMELDQLFEKTPYMRERNANIHPFDFGVLTEAFRIKETTPVHLPSAEKGIRTSVGKSKGELEDKERNHKKKKDKDKDRKKHKKRRIDNSGDVDKTNKNVTNGLKTVQLKEQPDMFQQKRRLNRLEDLSVRENKRVSFLSILSSPESKDTENASIKVTPGRVENTLLTFSGFCNLLRIVQSTTTLDVVA